VTAASKPGDPADKAADGAFGGVTSPSAGYGDKLARLERWLRRYPSATLGSGEGAVLLAEIDRLREQLYLADESAASSSAHAATLRTAIERVRALHGRHKCCFVCEPQCIECDVAYPCPTLRALDGEDA
jgi:hypothetical protein